MKRVLVVLALFGAALLLTASKQDKLDWCHFPPGQYPNKVLILSISENAIDGHLNHQGDGPVNFEPDYPNLKALGADCSGTPCTIQPFLNPAHPTCTITPTASCLCPATDTGGAGCGNTLPGAGGPISGSGTPQDPFSCGGAG